MCSPADDSMLVIALTGCVAAPLIGARVFISASDRALAKSGVAAPDAPRLFRWCGYGFAIAVYWWVTLAVVIPWDRLQISEETVFVVYLIGLVAAMSAGTFAALRAAIGAIRPALVVLPVNAAFVAISVWWWTIDGDPMPIVFILVPLCMLLWLGVYNNAMETWATQTRQRYGGRACASCGYDLRGLPPTTCCPECGAAPHTPTTP